MNEWVLPSVLWFVEIATFLTRTVRKHYASYSTLPAHISFLCHSERQRRIWRTHLCTLSYHRSFTPPAASFRMTGHHSFYIHILPFIDMCASNLHSTLRIQLSLHTSRSFAWHLRRQTLIYALGGILSAHISRKGREDMRSANIISLYFITCQCVMDYCCSRSASWERGHEQALSIMHWFWLQYRNAMFVLRDWVPEGKLFPVIRKLSV